MAEKKNKLPWLTARKPFRNLQDTEEAKRAYRQVYNTRRWRRLRAQKLTDTPYCEWCARVYEVVEAQYVDHIRPILQGGEAWSMENLQSLCKACHAKKSAKDARMYKKKR